MDDVWALWSDFEQIPRWMPWIHSVKTHDEGLSDWTLKKKVAGVSMCSFSWVKRNIFVRPQPDKH